MFSFFKKKPAPAEPAALLPTELPAPEAAQPASGENEKRSWLDRLRGAPAEPIAEPALVREIEIAAPPVPEVETIAPDVVVEPAPERRSWIEKLRGGLRKTGSGIAEVFTGTQIDDALYEELESALLMADAGVKATDYLLADLKWRVAEERAKTPQAVKALLANAIADLLRPLERGLEVGKHVPTVMMVVGVNGAGKTTSIGKLTRHLAEANQKVLLAAADTFRAAAREQLAVWAGRNRVEIVGQEGGDPAAVTFDAVVAGKSRGCDVVIADTAGRLTTQVHLMDELKKIRRVIAKAQEGAPHEVLLVVDGNTGQNALTQVQTFDAALQLTGLIITKLDGTAKGGVLAAIALWSRERSHAGGAVMPVYFIGVGEKLEDLQTFDAREFAQALLS
ncbi:MAG: signal recognition particle-docking protein FtsY [Burkholderiales bacterium]